MHVLFLFTKSSIPSVLEKENKFFIILSYMASEEQTLQSDSKISLPHQLPRSASWIDNQGIKFMILYA